MKLGDRVNIDVEQGRIDNLCLAVFYAEWLRHDSVPRDLLQAAAQCGLISVGHRSIVTLTDAGRDHVLEMLQELGGDA